MKNKIIANHYSDCVIVSNKEDYINNLKTFEISKASSKESFHNSECALIKAISLEDAKNAVRAVYGNLHKFMYIKQQGESKKTAKEF